MGKNFDREMAKRVWERVQTAQPEVSALPVDHKDELQQLILEEWQQAQVYSQLIRQLPPKQAAGLRKLYEQKKAQIDCLKGIYRLVAGVAPAVHGVAPKPEAVSMQLRKCYGRQMRCLARYEAKTTDPEYGSVYAGLVHQNRNHCQVLLELLGALAK